MRAVIVGAGKIGCGYLAPLFRAAGHDVVLCCRTPDRAAKVRAAGGWRVRTTGAKETRYAVSGIHPVAAGTPELDAAVAEADLVAISVGVTNVAAAAEQLVTGLAARHDRPVDVWVVENGDCGPRVRAALERAADARGLSLPPTGVAGAVPTVAVARGSWADDAVPEFVGDTVRELVVDGPSLRGGLPILPGVHATRQYRARLHEKLFVFNAGHALTAYLGWLRGHSTVASAVGDPFVRRLVAGALLEARRATLAAYPGLLNGAEPDLERDVHRPVAEALTRYGDTALAEPVTRVARDPLRKLAPGDRLLGPVTLLRGHTGRVPAHFALGIAAALLYGYGDEAVLEADLQARRLRHLLDEHGLDAALEIVCGLDDRDPVARAVAERYRGFVFTDDGVRFPPAAPDRDLEFAV